MRLQRTRRSRKMVAGFQLGLWLCLPLFTCADELVFSSIEKTPITLLAERLLDRAYGELGYDIKTVVMPSRRSLKMANSGWTDGDLFRIAGIEKVFTALVPVPYPLIQGRLLVVTMKSGTPRQLSDGVIGVRRGIIIAEQATRTMKTIRVNDFEQMLDLLRVGRIDAGVVSEVEGVSSMTDEQMSRVTVLPQPLATFTLYHYLNKKHENLVVPLARVIQHLVENGEFSAIVKAAQQK